MRSLTLAEARERSSLITVTSYAVELDLDQGAEVFGSRTSVRFTCAEPGAGLVGRPQGPLGRDDLAQRRVARPGRRRRRPPPARRASPPTTSSSSPRRWPTATTDRACTGPPTPPTTSTTSTATSSSTPPRASTPASTSPTSRRPTTSRSTRPLDWTVIGNGAASAGGRRHVEPRDDEAARDVLRDGVRRTVRLRPRRARRHTPGPPRAGLAARAARAARGRALRRDEAVVRLLPRALRHPLPVRGVPPGLRAGVQRRRDGEPRLRHLPRPVPLPRRRDPRRAADPGQHGQPRDVAHVVRRHRDDEVVGRPLAQRVVRRVHVAPVPRRRHRVHRRVGRLLDRAQGVGLRRRALPVDPPGRRRRGARRAERAAELRRHLVRQGRGHAAPAHRVRRRRPVHRRRPRLPDRQVLRQRHARRLPRRDRDGERQGPRGVVAGLAADGRPRHDLGRGRGAGGRRRVRRRAPRGAGRPSGRPARTPSTSRGGPTGASSVVSRRPSPDPRRPSPSSRAPRSPPSSCRTRPT